MLWRIEPGIAVGSLAFGMKREQILQILGKSYEDFKRTPESPDVVSAFDREGLHLVFGSNDTLKQVTIFTPNEVILGSTQLLGRALAAVRDDLGREVFCFEPVDAGLWCKEAGVLLIDVDGNIDGVEIYQAV